MSTNEIIHKKLQVLYDMCFILKDDERIPQIIKVLEGKNEIQADNWMRDIILGRKTLNQKLTEEPNKTIVHPLHLN